jgi:hypothetical protein
MEIRGRRQLSLQLGETSAASVVGPYVSEGRVEPFVRCANRRNWNPAYIDILRIQELAFGRL